MQKYTKYVKIRKNHPRHLYKFLLPLLPLKGGNPRRGGQGWGAFRGMVGSHKVLLHPKDALGLKNPFITVLQPESRKKQSKQCEKLLQ